MSANHRPPEFSGAGERPEHDATDAILLRVDPSGHAPFVIATDFHPPALGRSLSPGAKSARQTSATPLPSLPSSASRPPAPAPSPTSTRTTTKETN